MAAWPYIAVIILACALPCEAANLERPSMTLKADIGYVVQLDGTYLQTYRSEFHPASDADARREAQQAVFYSPSLESVIITEAYTEKPDGRRLAVTPAGIHDQLPWGTQDLANFSDQRQKVLVFPDVAGGDVLVYAWRRVVRAPVFTGQFMASAYLPRSNPWTDMTLTVQAPAALKLHTEAHDMTESVEAEGVTVVYHWHASNQSPPMGDAAVIGPYDRLPRVFVSSFPGYQSFAEAYGALANPKAAVTPPIQALADRLTSGIADRREQARALYDWVSLNIRYIAVYLVMGALEPHPAAAVLADGYGDCKDHVVLFNALLAARGIKADLVMVNLGAHYTLSGPPTFAQLNHAITYLPEFDLYADTSAGAAPFGALPFEEYGKPVVHAVNNGIALRHIPPLAPDQATVEVRTEAVMNDEGVMSGTTLTVAHGPFAIGLRRTSAWARAVGISGAASAQLRALGTDGSGSFALPPADDLAVSYATAGSFRLDAQPGIIEGDSFMPPIGLRMLMRPGDLLLGPARKLAYIEPTPCFAGHQTEDISLQLPAGRHLTRMPKNLSFENDLLAYRSSWEMTGQVLAMHRDLVSHPAHSVCSGSERRLAAEALNTIHRDERRQIALADE